MDSLLPLRKKPRHDTNGAADHPSPLLDRKLRTPFPFVPEKEPLSTNIGSKTKACLKFFSTSGCPYGEGCHFSHYVPGGVGSIAYSQSTSSVTGTLILPSSQGVTFDGHRSQLCKNIANSESSRGHPERETWKSNPVHLYDKDGFSSFSSSLDQGPTEGYKTRMCKNVHSSEGCRFGDKCHFAHSESELRKSNTGAREPTSPGIGAAASFGSVSTAKISIDASLAGVIIGKAGINAKSICRTTGAKLFIRDHESDPNLRNIEMEGSLDQIQRASAMVRDLLVHMDIAPTKPGGTGTPNYKTKLCENFANASCTYGDRCHFAHGLDELRTAMP